MLRMPLIGLAAISCSLFANTTFAETRSPNATTPKLVGKVTSMGSPASLVVINAKDATLKDDKLTLTDVAGSAIVFAERPQKAAGHLSTEDLIEQWGKGPDNFDDDPPNATISVLGRGAEPSDAVVTLKHPKLEGSTLTFDVSVLEGSLAGASGPAALFIDHWRGWDRAGWYGLGAVTGAAVGASLLRPSPPPPVYPAQYYDYPPVVEAACPPGLWLGPWGDCRDTPYHGRLPNGGWQ